MRLRTVMAIFLACAGSGLAQEHLADTLRNGIVEEDSKQNPRAAIQQYQAVMAQFVEARQTAATALFRIAECYRKQGNRTQAIAEYQRLLKDFADQTKLAAQSRALLATIYSVAPAGAPAAGNPKIAGARARYRESIVEEMAVDEKQLAFVRERQRAGVEGALASGDLEAKLLRLKRDLAAFDAGMTVPARGPR